MDIKSLNRYLISKHIIASIIIVILFSIISIAYYTHNTSVARNNGIISRLSGILDLSLNIENDIKEMASAELPTQMKKNAVIIKSYIDSLQISENIDSVLTTEIASDNAIKYNRDVAKLKEQLLILHTQLDSALQTTLNSQLSDTMVHSILTRISSINKIALTLSNLIIADQTDSIAYFDKINILIWLAALLALHFITIFIFRPFNKKISQLTLKLEDEKSSALEKAQLKSEHLAMLSQQIRTPLNGVLGLTGLLLETTVTKEQKEYLELVRDSGENLLQVVNDVFDFSKIESATIELNEMYFSIHVCIEEIIDTYLPKCKMKNLELIYIIEPDVPDYILGDSRKLNQCLSKLVNNAIKFTRKGEIFIRVNVLNTIDDLYEIQFSVSDTGIGIQENKQKNLFNPLQQSKAPVSKRFEGTGLGLAIVSRLVQLMNGRVWVESEINIGSTFYMAIQYKADTHVKHNEQDISLLSKKHIIILDQSANNRNILTVQCHNWGMYPKHVSTTKELFSELKSGQKIDYLLIDGHLLAENPDLIKNVRKIDKCNDLPIILLQSDGKKMGKFKNVMTLAKPIRQASLYDLLIYISHIQKSGIAEKAIKEQPRQKLSVLSAEDNLINQKLTEQIVIQLGHQIDLAMDGAEAVNKAKEKDYDIIFMDLQMPEMDSLDATRSILKNAKVQKPKIIAMTSIVQTRDKELCFKAGMTDYIAKPISFEKIKHLIEYWGNSDQGSASKQRL